MTGEVRTAVCDAPPVNKKEILRYARAKEASDAVLALLDECISLAQDGLSYRVAYAVYPIARSEEGISIGFLKTSSQDLAKNLTGCHAAVAFCATVGHTLDRLVRRESVTSPARALLLDAYGTERVEALADAFCGTLAEESARDGCVLRPRFSPGYGDLPLSLQKEIFSALNLPERLGVTLNESLLMTPKKSVTAFVGIAAKEQV